MEKKQAVIEEAIRELNMSDEPDLYHRFRRWVRKNIKRQLLEPIDIMNWPKGCLMVGLMHQSKVLSEARTSSERALSIVAASTVKEHVDKWIKNGTHVYKIDDCLAGQAVLALGCMDVRYMDAASKMMNFLYAHDKDREGCLPYRPNQRNGRIFADGIGMVAPFAVRYGLMTGDDDAIELGMNQIRGFMRYGLNDKTGLPWHAYSLSESEASVESKNDVDVAVNSSHLGDLGWGRAMGWLMYGVRASLDAVCEMSDTSKAVDNVPNMIDEYYLLTVRKELEEYINVLSQTARKYQRKDGLFTSPLGKEASFSENKGFCDEPQIDTSASAMILYGMGVSNFEELEAQEELKKFITVDGKVMQAQGECLDFGVYNGYGSYPWSVGMSLLVLDYDNY